jgi:DNA-binding GntR family transcriptional regulator
MARTAVAHTRGGHVYEAIRAAILAGKFEPGEKLRPNEMREQYGVSLSVVREALARLAEQHLVVSRRNHGFQVMPVSEKALRDITDLRVAVESFAMRRAIEMGDVAWEAEIVATHHTLTVTPYDRSKDSNSNEAWHEAHRRFHYALLEGCDMPIVLDLCSSLFDGTRLYRLLAVPVTKDTRDVVDEHAQIMAAALRRDADECVARLGLHYRTTAKVLLENVLHVPSETDAGIL